MPLETTGLSVLGAQSGVAPWFQAAASGNRPAVDILMSTYDTNPSSTDHTTAFQTAIAAAANIITSQNVAKVRIFLDTRQKYTIGGAVTSGANGQYAQIPLPYLNNGTTGTIELVGLPRGNEYDYLGSSGQSGTVIESTLGAAPAFSGNTGIASTFGGPSSFRSRTVTVASCTLNGTTAVTVSSGGFPGAYQGMSVTGTNIPASTTVALVSGNTLTLSAAATGSTTTTLTFTNNYPNQFSYLRFSGQDITIRSASPVVCGIDAGWLTGFSWQGLLQFTTDYLATQGINYAAMTPCTAPQAIPIVFPFNLDWYGTVGDHLVVAGWAYGPMLGEYQRARSVTVFATNCCLLTDAANQASRIDYLTDWNNAYGIATLDGLFAGVTPVSPAAGAAPGSKRTIASSITAGLTPSPVHVGTWEIQISQGGTFPAATQRVYDILDANGLAIVRGGEFVATDDAGNVCAFGSTYFSGGNLKIFGFGSSATGAAVRISVKNSSADNGPQSITAAATTVAIRNPVGRDCLVQALNPAGANPAAITTYTVNGTAISTNAGNSACLVPAQGTLAITYSSGAPAMVWTAI